MATYQIEDSYPPFDYGSAVRWTDKNGNVREGGICGFSKVSSKSRALVHGVQIGAVLVLVEQKSGEVAEIPVDRLTLID
jgi:hypothetical protein